LLTGKIYRTTASIANAQPRDAFDGAMAFTTGNGFTVQSSDKNAGTISAVQTGNKRVPLAILLSPDGVNTKLAFTYQTPAGVHSPEDAIKKHFCSTVVAATNTVRAGAATPIAAAVAAPAPQQPHQHTPPPRPIQRGAPVGYAEITDDQKKAIETALMKNVPNDRIREMVKEAASSITQMAERMGCLADNKGASALNEFAAPNVPYGSGIQYNFPMHHAKYHDKSSCLSVLRISGWLAPANNALRYEVLYKSDASGESRAVKHEVVRQPDNSWLFILRNDF
jgi:hypothetical protein